MFQKTVYFLLKTYCKVALWFYFKKWQVANEDKIPKGPLIFVANHQNAFLDAVLVACSTRRNPWFLARANVFHKPWAKKILTLFQMSPVYRFRDGYSTLRKNDEIIDRCVSLLQQHESILIFAEGNHNDQYFLRALQKGFARIAFAAEEANHWQLDVKIIPVGIQYDAHTKFRSRVLVNFAEPIRVSEVSIEANMPATLAALIEITEEKIKSLMLHIPPEEYQERLRYLNSHRIIKQDLVQQLLSDQKMVEKNYGPNGAIPRKIKTPFTKKMVLFWQRANHFLPKKIIQWILNHKVSDPQFIGSLQFAIGMILVPVFYLLQSALLFVLTDSLLITALYFITLPVSIAMRR